MVSAETRHVLRKAQPAHPQHRRVAPSQLPARSHTCGAYHSAVQDPSGWVGGCRALCEHGADVDHLTARGWSALSYAAACGPYPRAYEPGVTPVAILQVRACVTPLHTDRAGGSIGK